MFNTLDAVKLAPSSQPEEVARAPRRPDGRRWMLGQAGRLVLAACAFGCATQAGSATAQPLVSQAGPYEVEVLVDGATAPTFFHGGESYVLGHLGRRYTLRVHNRSALRVEAVVSVDGRDVVDGKPADFRNKRGYLIPAWGSVDIDGWRVSMHTAAAFRFTSVPDSYAARMGNPRNVGVIGVAVFPERAWRPRPQPVTPYNPYRRPFYGSDEAERDSFLGHGSGAPASEPPMARRAAPEGGPSASQASEEATDDLASQGRARAEAAGPSKAKGALAERSRDSGRIAQRPGLGTEFGEAVSSKIREVSFVRANASAPAALLGLRYNDRRGLLAVGIDVDGHDGYDHDQALRRTATPFPISRFAAPPSGWRR
jgi:hypothetical protein